MSNQHAYRAVTVRPPNDLTDKVKALLTERQRELRGFVVACFSALVADPDRFFAAIDAHWPTPTPRGRPKRPPSG